MAIRVIKSSGDVYADLGIKRRRKPHHGSTLDSFLGEESAKRRPKGRRRRYKSRMKAALHETTEDLFLAGIVSEKRMKACDDLCLTRAGKAMVLARRRRRKSRVGAAAKKRARNPHLGSTLDSFLEEERRKGKLRKTMRTRAPWDTNGQE